METKLTVPISAKDTADAMRQIKSAVAGGAEMLELRLDYFENLTAEIVAELISKVKKRSRTMPLIVTCRDIKQGGAIDYPVTSRLRFLCQALKAGAEVIDFEYENFKNLINQEKIRLALTINPSARLILSAHNFEGPFENISQLYRKITTLYPAAIPKLVYKANHINDCFEALDLLYKTSGQRTIFCMGKAGIITRIIAKKLGSFVTFATVDGKNATAEGQLAIKEYKKLYRYDFLTKQTQLYGVVGSPIAHSMSPHIHNDAFARIKADKLYLPLLVEGGKEEFYKFLNCIINRNWLSFRGLSVTIPHKQNALEYILDASGKVEPLCQRIGAINTIIIKNDYKIEGCNTDISGATEAIRSHLKTDIKGLEVSIVGAGGVSRAIVAGLRQAGAKIKIYNRTVKKAQRLAEEFGCRWAGLGELENMQADLFVNCTSLGMSPDIETTPIPKELLKKEMAVFDTVYNPPMTTLLKEAKSKKACIIDGVSMFVNQAAEQFRLFTGEQADKTRMKKIVSKHLAD